MSIKNRIRRLILGRKEKKTLEEKRENVPQQQPSRPEDSLYNPLRLNLGDLVELRFENAGTYELYQFTEHATRITDVSYRSTRYFLRERSALEEFEPLALEWMTSRHDRPPRPYLFHIVEEFGYDEDFLTLLDDDIFLISEETENEEIVKEYEKRFHVSSSTITVDETQGVHNSSVTAWNYELEDEFETLYLIVEINRQDGWTTIYEGRRLLEGELELYQLSRPGGK